MRSFYTILGCEDEATTSEEIKRCYFTKLRQLHPDKNQENSDVDEFVIVNQAWTILGDYLSRKKYDCWLKEQRFRESKELIGKELVLDLRNFTTGPLEEDCRCGGEFIAQIDELEKILDYGLFECSNCSLLLKIQQELLTRDE